MKETEKIEIMHFDQEGYLEDGKALYETGKKMTALADKVADEGYDAVFLMGVGGTWDELMQLEYLMNKFAALLSNTTRSVSREIREGFVSAPKGCYIQLEKKAAKYILDNIRASYGNTAGLMLRIGSFAEDSGLELTLGNFLRYLHLDSRSIYKYASFSRLCVRAGVREDFREPLEELSTKAFAKFAVVDSRTNKLVVG